MSSDMPFPQTTLQSAVDLFESYQPLGSGAPPISVDGSPYKIPGRVKEVAALSYVARLRHDQALIFERQWKAGRVSPFSAALLVSILPSNSTLRGTWLLPWTNRMEDRAGDPAPHTHYVTLKAPVTWNVLYETAFFMAYDALRPYGGPAHLEQSCFSPVPTFQSDVLALANHIVEVFLDKSITKYRPKDRRVQWQVARGGSGEISSVCVYSTHTHKASYLSPNDQLDHNGGGIYRSHSMTEGCEFTDASDVPAHDSLTDTAQLVDEALLNALVTWGGLKGYTDLDAKKTLQGASLLMSEKRLPLLDYTKWDGIRASIYESFCAGRDPMKVALPKWRKKMTPTKAKEKSDQNLKNLGVKTPKPPKPSSTASATSDAVEQQVSKALLGSSVVPPDQWIESIEASGPSAAEFFAEYLQGAQELYSAGSVLGWAEPEPPQKGERSDVIPTDVEIKAVVKADPLLKKLAQDTIADKVPADDKALHDATNQLIKARTTQVKAICEGMLKDLNKGSVTLKSDKEVKLTAGRDLLRNNYEATLKKARELRQRVADLNEEVDFVNFTLASLRKDYEAIGQGPQAAIVEKAKMELVSRYGEVYAPLLDRTYEAVTAGERLPQHLPEQVTKAKAIEGLAELPTPTEQSNERVHQVVSGEDTGEHQHHYRGRTLPRRCNAVEGLRKVRRR